MDMIYTSVYPSNAPRTLGCRAFAQLDTIPRHCFDPTLSVPNIPTNAYNLNLYPNPNNGVLTISYDLSNNSYIQFTIIDCIGRELLILNDEHKPPGTYKQQVNIGSFASGAYLLIANINGDLQTIKFIKL